MYISEISIDNYRNFESISIRLKDGINLLIGQNNAGKSNLIRALRLLFDPSSKKQLTLDDIFNNIPLENLKENSPKVTISACLSQSVNENLMGDELVTVSNWLITLRKPYKAKIQYEFFLPESEEARYLEDVKYATSTTDIWKILRNGFIRHYIYKVWVGNPENQVPIDSESLSKFDFQFLDAIRDVERDMFSGRNTLLKNLIDFFIDYDIKSDKDLTGVQQSEKIKCRRDDFEVVSNKLIKKLQTRLKSGTKEILTYSSDIGASFDNSLPDFEGRISESELYSVLQLIIKQSTGMNIPISNNGLGYNNLIFMSLLLAKMQVDSDGKYLGSNAKVFPILAIEEPEAHLHPTMQFQFIKFLKKNIKEKKVKQVFITSHSTHITSSTNLDNIICLYKENTKTRISYPGKVFYNLNLDEDPKMVCKENSKKYVQRFLDATKSNMLFAEKIIFVEGIAEQLLIPIFAEYLDKPLEENHIIVINIGGRYFDHFLCLFDGNKDESIKRKIACITDIDPTRKEITKNNSKPKRCYPYELNEESAKYNYSVNKSMDKYKDGRHPNIRSFTQNEVFGKTLEYQLAFENENSMLLLTPSTQNYDELTKIISSIQRKYKIEDLLRNLKDSDENKRIADSIKYVSGKQWDEKSKMKAVFASRYLNSVGKGENALELSVALKENLENRGTDEYLDFNVPEYIHEAIDWMCEEL